MNTFDISSSASVSSQNLSYFRPQPEALSKEAQKQAFRGLIGEAERCSPFSYSRNREGERSYKPDGKVTQQEIDIALSYKQELVQDLRHKRDFYQDLVEQKYIDPNETARTNMPYLIRNADGKAIYSFERGAKVPSKNKEWELRYSGSLLQDRPNQLNPIGRELSDGILNNEAKRTQAIDFKDIDGNGAISNAEVIASIDARIAQEEGKVTVYQSLSRNYATLSAYQNDSENTIFGRSPEYLTAGDMNRVIDSTDPGNQGYLANLAKPLQIAKGLPKEPSYTVSKDTNVFAQRNVLDPNSPITTAFKAPTTARSRFTPSPRVIIQNNLLTNRD
jgi:hypothetical protein